MKKESVIENIMVFLFVLLLLPFPKIAEEILVGSIFILCFIYCFFVSLKFIKKSNEILLYNIPYLTIITLILQIHSVRFSLLANNIQEQLFCVQLYKWLTDRLPNKEAFLIGFLIYFWLLLYILILFLENGVKRKIEVSKKLNQDTLNVQKQDIAYKEYAGIISDKQAVIENDNLSENDTLKTEKSLGIKSALKKIKKYRKEIKFAAEIFNVDPNGIASVIFQEKYHGIFADGKDFVSYVIDDIKSGVINGGVNDETPSTRSYGLAEMQLCLAAKIWGLDTNAPGTNKKAYDLLMNDRTSIAFIAAYISINEKEIGQKLYGADAAGAHNMGSVDYKKVLNKQKEKRPIAKRSEQYQKAIQDALNGKIDMRKDGER